MAIFALICLSVTAACSFITMLFIISDLGVINEKLNDIYVKVRDHYYMIADIHSILYDIRELKRNKIRKKINCYNERDLK